jgi:uncharacterized caspase-like protein
MRLRRFAVSAVFAIAAFGAAWPAHAADRVALVVGNGAYVNANALPNPVNDASDMAAALRELGFETIAAINLDKAGFDQRLRDFARMLRGAKTALFYYAGHGLQVAGKNYAVPVDARLESAADLTVETVDLDQVLSVMQADDNRVNLVFLDACRDNPLARSFARSLPATRALAVNSGLSALDAGRGTLIAFATAPNKVALDGQGRNSPFTGALLRHIRTPGLDIAFVMRRVTADVEAQTGGAQIPWVHASLTTDVALNPGGAPQAPPPRPPVVASADPGATLTPAASAIAAPNLPLPDDLPVDTQVLRMVETHPFFANAPPVRLGSYGIESVASSKWSQSGHSGTSNATNRDNYSIRWLRAGITAANWGSEGAAIDSRGTTRSTSRGSSILAGSGLIQLALKQVSPNGGRTFTNTSKLLRLENLQGQLYPLQVGNHFGFTQAMQWRTSMGFKDDYTYTVSCDVARKYDARTFNAELTGAAYVALCRTTSVWNKTTSSNGTGQFNQVFFESLGYWLSADQLVPQERLVENTETTTITATTTRYSLKSFGLVR